MKILDFLPLLVLAFAAFRITRFFIIDSLTESLRNKFHIFLVNKAEGKLGFLWNKIYELTSCTWCFGFWISLSVYWLYTWTSPLNWGRFGWISAVAVAGVQGLLHAFEPGDE